MEYTTHRSRETIVMNPATPPTASVIWLHGLGADGTDFVPLVPELHLPDNVAPRFVFPNAPLRPVTANHGMLMPAWYDVFVFSDKNWDDAVGIPESAALVHGLIDRERAAGISTTRIVLAGFSQGGAIALHAGLRYAQPLAGILALSTFLPLAATLAVESSAANRTIPILMCHGRQDPILSVELARKSCATLIAQGYHPRLLEYPMEHTLCAEEVVAISQWLAQVLPPV
jgi:phospholipase/carboxylesterase